MDKRHAIARNNKLAMQSANEGNFAAALEKLTQAVMWADELDAPLLLAVSKNNMGIACQMQGRFPEARTCFTIAHTAVVEQGKPEDHPLLTVINRNMQRLAKANVSQAA